MALTPEAAALISRQLAEVHRAAEERLGLAAAVATLAAWERDITLTAPAFTADLAAAIIDIARALRQVSRRLAARYYNLARAVGQGYAYPDIGQAFSGQQVTLGELFAAMAESMNEVMTSTELDVIPKRAQVAPADTQSDGSDDRTLEERLDDLEDALIDMLNETFPEEVLNEPVQIELPSENWDWPDLNEDVEDDELLDEIIDVVNEYADRVKKELRSERTMQESLAKLQEPNAIGAAKAAGAVDKQAMEAGRHLTWAEGNRDPRRYAWMRVTGPSPCAFCAMLASRGAVYNTAASAGYGNPYHPYCHCHVQPMFIDTPYYSAKDQYFIDNWPKVTNGSSGRAARKVWRKWLTQQYRKGLVPEHNLFGPQRPSTPDSLEE